LNTPKNIILQYYCNFLLDKEKILWYINIVLLYKRFCRIMNKRKNSIIFFIIVALWGFLSVYGCPIYKLCGITCPTCGVTRAWISFISGNIDLAFRYNLFFLFIPFIVYLYIFPPKHRFFQIGTIIFTIVLFAYNVLRWLGLFVLPS